MDELQFNALLPYTLLGAASMVIILLIAFRSSHTVIQIIGFLLMCAVIMAMIRVRHLLPVSIMPLFEIDSFSYLFTAMIVFAVLVIGLLSYIYFEEKEENPKEYYILLFLATLGASVLTISRHFISFFIGLELLSVSLYALIAYLRTRNHAVEAGMKYLMLAAFSSAFLVFGMALTYMETGSMEFGVIGQSLLQQQTPSILFVTGAGLMIVAIGFKLALVPFHLWAADVYQGAPVPVTAFIASVSKIGVFAVLLRFALMIDLQRFPIVVVLFSVIAIVSMIAGNILALRQQNLKRLIAYSSIAHLGYLLVAFLPANEGGVRAAVFYLIAYTLTILAAFGVITVSSSREKDADSLESYRGLFWRRPVLAMILTIAFLSFAGIPLTAGFIGKFYVLATGVQQGVWLPVVVLALTSVIGLYYYLRVIATLFAESGRPEKAARTLHPFFYTSTYITLIVLVICLFWLGIFPGPMLDGIRTFLQIR